MSGQVVESTSEVRRRDRGNSYFERLKPVAALNAATSYEFVLLLGASGLVLAQFTTGLETDDEPPPAPQLTSFVPELMIGVSGGSSCLGGYMGRFGRFRTALAPLSSDTAYALLLVHSSDSEHWQSDAIPLFESRDFLALGVNDAHCAANPPILDLGSTVCARVVASDLAGNSTISVELCDDTVQCTAGIDSDTGLPVAECVPPGFFGGGGGGGGGCRAANSPGTGVLVLLLMWLGLRRPRSVFGRRVDQRATTSFAAGQSSAR